MLNHHPYRLPCTAPWRATRRILLVTGNFMPSCRHSPAAQCQACPGSLRYSLCSELGQLVLQVLTGTAGDLFQPGVWAACSSGLASRTMTCWVSRQPPPAHSWLMDCQVLLLRPAMFKPMPTCILSQALSQKASAATSLPDSCCGVSLIQINVSLIRPAGPHMTLKGKPPPAGVLLQ